VERRKMVAGEGGKREGEQEGEERKCKEANLVKVK